MPWVICARSGAKLREGRAMVPIAVNAADAPALLSNVRRVIAIRSPPSSCGGRCLLILTKARTLCDGGMTLLRLFSGCPEFHASHCEIAAVHRLTRKRDGNISGRSGLRAAAGTVARTLAGSRSGSRIPVGVIENCSTARRDGEAKLIQRERERHAHFLVELLVLGRMDD